MDKLLELLLIIVGSIVVSVGIGIVVEFLYNYLKSKRKLGIDEHL